MAGPVRERLLYARLLTAFNKISGRFRTTQELSAAEVLLAIEPEFGKTELVKFTAFTRRYAHNHPTQTFMRLKPQRETDVLDPGSLTVALNSD